MFWLDREAEDDFRDAGIDGLSSLCSLGGGRVVSRAATRICRRLELGGRTYYVKTQEVIPRRLPLRKWPSYLGRGSPLAREARNFLRLKGLGIPTPIVAGWGAERFPWGMPRRSALVTRALEGYVDLEALAAGDPDRAASLVGRLEELVAHLHRLGWALGGVKLRNVLAGPGGELALIDLPDLTRRPMPGRKERDFRVLRADAERVLGRDFSRPGPR